MCDDALLSLEIHAHLTDILDERRRIIEPRKMAAKVVHYIPPLSARPNAHQYKTDAPLYDTRLPTFATYSSGHSPVLYSYWLNNIGASVGALVYTVLNAAGYSA
jgi:hypothetical protein